MSTKQKSKVQKIRRQNKPEDQKTETKEMKLIEDKENDEDRKEKEDNMNVSMIVKKQE